MAWTQQDYDAVETAIRAVRDGTRKQSVSSETGALAYMNTPLPDLIKLRDAIRLEIGVTSDGTAPDATLFDAPPARTIKKFPMKKEDQRENSFAPEGLGRRKAARRPQRAQPL